MKSELGPIAITDPSDERVAEYRDLRENRLIGAMEGAPHGVFIAEGEKVVRLLAEGVRYRVRSVLISAKQAGLAAELGGRGWPVYVAEPAVMDAVAGFEVHRGVLASGLRRAEEPLAEVLAGARGCFVLEGLSNHDNVGGLFRVAAAMGGEGFRVILDRRSCDPLYRKSIRVSMGHVLRVPYGWVDGVPGALAEIQAQGLTPVALTTDPGAPGIETLGRIERPALLLGSEGEGLSAGALSQVHVWVRIPMAPGVDSLNVVTAGAVALNRLLPIG